MQTTEKIYRDKVYGCWLGKSIGGTIGGPHEGAKDFLDLPMEYPREAIANDDLDIQLVWLKVLRDRGLDIDAGDLGRAWLKHVTYPFDEYGVARANLAFGLEPPATGYYNNWFVDCMGAPIRSEIWACVFPGRPKTAAWYALQDAQVDHWGEGIYGEIFLAALESMAFESDSLETLVAEALEFIPGNCRISGAVQRAAEGFASGETLQQSRDAILAAVGHHNFTDAPQNLGFTVLGLLHGQGDLLKTIISAANCGYDVDCTAATAGAIAGIIAGGTAVLDQTDATIDKRVVAGYGIRECQPPDDLQALTEQTCALGIQADTAFNLPVLHRPFILEAVPEFEAPMHIPCHYEQIPLEDGGAQPLLTDTADEIIFDGAFFDVADLMTEPETMLVIETCVDLPRQRALRFIPHCTAPVTLWVDNKKVVEWTDCAPLLPATHRGPEGFNRLNRDPLMLEAGVHEITIRILPPANSEKVEFVWIAADRNSHWITDLDYILKP